MNLYIRSEAVGITNYCHPEKQEMRELVEVELKNPNDLFLIQNLQEAILRDNMCAYLATMIDKRMVDCQYQVIRLDTREELNISLCGLVIL